MIYKMTDDRKLRWRFCKTDNNKWIWYCHEPNGYLVYQSDKAYASKIACVEDAQKYGYSGETEPPLFLRFSYIQGKGWKWYQCYGCGYIIKETDVIFSTYQACIQDAKQNCTTIPARIPSEKMEE
ncbi:hypothetical protein [Escherichia coli]|uniref:hypothetical protein n=1 Tax=Escherichia coli TaxID=562 RepID=UPI00140E662A|nr:hypothetical protein [Escherichia coli]EHL5995771.1 hypothetical protein [Escherichia coli]EHL6304207.1 hypothetical protein [Escherichia coli]NHR32873.1 hypothetical protein [Escherichia coli]HDW4069170.1 hypothetical protein [Escherichia coli]HEB5751184.1 hypothetical protein [Escherichia coli]